MFSGERHSIRLGYNILTSSPRNKRPDQFEIIDRNA